jgi:hypothetical protein
VTLCVPITIPRSIVEYSLNMPPVDTAKTPEPELVSMLAIVHELGSEMDMSLREFLFQAHRLNLPYVYVKKDFDVFWDRKKTLAALRGRFDVTTERTAAVCALFWQGMRRRTSLSERADHLARFLEGLNFESEKSAPRIRRLVDFAQRKSGETLNESARIVERLLYLGVICEERVEKMQRENKIERETFMRLRKIQAYSWASISAFDKVCLNRKRIVGLARFEKAMNKFAGQRLAHFDMRPRFIRERSAALQSILGLMRQHAKSRDTPSDWPKLIAQLRAFFYEANPRISTRDAVKIKGRIRTYAGRRGLRDELDVFNVTSYLRLVLGWKADRANTFAGWIVFPEASASEEANAPDTVRKYRQRFQRRFSLQNKNRYRDANATGA